MTNVQSIEQAVAQLPMQDLAEFRSWFAKFDAQAWDMQLESDATSGKLNVFAAEAVAEYKLGKAREF
jgi:hypothetical protein